MLSAATEPSAGPSAPVFDVQRFSVHDGPGIRTTVFLKGCPLRCAWCHNPESQRAGPELAFFEDRCRACGRCVDACPEEAIRVGDLRQTDRARCTGCGRCAEVCLVDACARVGEPREVNDVLAEVLRDRDYFGGEGGLTVSGGEPLLHREFVAALLAAAGEEGVHTCVQTCGHVPPSALEQVLPYTRLFQFDLKQMSSERHRALTGVGNEAIVANARALAGWGAPVEFRMPVVPGANDDDANVGATARFLAELGAPSVRLVPYRGWYAAKDRMLGRPVRPVAPAALARARLEQVSEGFASRGIAVELDG